MKYLPLPADPGSAEWLAAQWIDRVDPRFARRYAAVRACQIGRLRRDVAAQFGISTRVLANLLRKYRAKGVFGLSVHGPRAIGMPKKTPPPDLMAAVVMLRDQMDREIPREAEATHPVCHPLIMTRAGMKRALALAAAGLSPPPLEIVKFPTSPAHCPLCRRPFETKGENDG